MGLGIKVCFYLIFKTVCLTFAFKGSNLVSFFRENETESRLLFSETLKQTVGHFRKIAIGSEKWTCMLCIRLLDKVNEGAFSYISTLKLWGKIHISTLTMWM